MKKKKHGWQKSICTWKVVRDWEWLHDSKVFEHVSQHWHGRQHEVQKHQAGVSLKWIVIKIYLKKSLKNNELMLHYLDWCLLQHSTTNPRQFQTHFLLQRPQHRKVVQPIFVYQNNWPVRHDSAKFWHMHCWHYNRPNVIQSGLLRLKHLLKKSR